MSRLLQYVWKALLIGAIFGAVLVFSVGPENIPIRMASGDAPHSLGSRPSDGFLLVANDSSDDDENDDDDSDQDDDEDDTEDEDEERTK